MEYVTLHKEEMFGKYSLGVEIRVASKTLPDLDNPEIRIAAYDAAKRVSSEIFSAMRRESTEYTNEINENNQLLTVFTGAIFVEEIPNQYCSDWCCRHLSWFVVTTTIGRIKIGWRKRVISIDWTDTMGTKTSRELFVDEDVTKGEKSIHAWSLDDAKRYVKTIIGN